VIFEKLQSLTLMKLDFLIFLKKRNNELIVEIFLFEN